MRSPLTLELLATPKDVREVRRELRAYVGGPCADLQLCASELLTNVIRHLGESVPVTVRVCCTPGRTRLEVTDPDPRALPVLCRTAGEDDETGRGLALLDALCVRWGVDPRPGSKTVWCELAAQSSGAADVVHSSSSTVSVRAAVSPVAAAGSPGGRTPRRVRGGR
ncbi:ATP-binding protein [Streptomyces sp. NPDC004069]